MELVFVSVKWSPITAGSLAESSQVTGGVKSKLDCSVNSHRIRGPGKDEFIAVGPGIQRGQQLHAADERHRPEVSRRNRRSPPNT